MQNWTEEMWQILLIGLIIGFFIGYLVARFTNGSVKAQKQTQQELRKAQDTIAEQKAQLEKHFVETADLMKSLAQDYQKLYQHFANSSTNLLPDNHKEIFALTQENPTLTDKPKQEQPKDYSEGSSGLFKHES
ncbi:YhcB family protein [Gallibacterium trehalosifermentans]|uniref:Z-ring associated protein G n=1 Tax=Gallibacterium trehalosifermentans TaxID=516935 RepID=A0ABV6H4H9_9PAST